uniref:DDE Tnp4 domain-containing protein n=1 Tax=Globisporangium ultimum (strain ATCC 200006 / CBS 805.95 / DAOM BR144) TaxID=431595 RepID=K3WCM6_GLOUD
MSSPSLVAAALALWQDRMRSDSSSDGSSSESSSSSEDDDDDHEMQVLAQAHQQLTAQVTLLRALVNQRKMHSPVYQDDEVNAATADSIGGHDGLVGDQGDPVAEFLRDSDDATFYDMFRMQRSSFTALLERVASKMDLTGAQTTFSGSTVSPGIALLLFLFHCVHRSSYEELSETFGIAPAVSCSLLIRQVAIAVAALELIKLPTSENEVRALADANEALSGVPQCVLSIGGTHCPIEKPAYYADAYLNAKGYYSTVLHAAVDHKLRFREIVAGWPGGLANSRVFASSSLRLSCKDWLKQFPAKLVPTMDKDNESLPMFLLGDAAYDSDEHLVTMYNDSDRENGPVRLALSVLHSYVTQAFTLLRRRFGVLLAPLATKADGFSAIPPLLFALCSLHNFLEDRGDSYDGLNDGDEDLRAFELSFPAPEQESSNEDNGGYSTRRVLEKYLLR